MLLPHCSSRTDSNCVSGAAEVVRPGMDQGDTPKKSSGISEGEGRGLGILYGRNREEHYTSLSDTVSFRAEVSWEKKFRGFIQCFVAVCGPGASMRPQQGGFYHIRA